MPTASATAPCRVPSPSRPIMTRGQAAECDRLKPAKAASASCFMARVTTTRAVLTDMRNYAGISSTLTP